MASLRILRILRTFRLTKLSRLLRASRVARRWSARLAINYSMLSLVFAIVSLVAVSHWVACAWAACAFMQASVGIQTIDGTWLGHGGFCWPRADASSAATPDGLLYSCRSPVSTYAAALYFAAMTISSIGYGDITPAPHNALEHFFCTFLMLLSSIAWAQTLASFNALSSTFRPERAAYRQTMDSLNRFMERESFPQELRTRLRAYFNASKHLRLAENQRDLLRHMPPSLQGEVCRRSHAVALTPLRPRQPPPACHLGHALEA